MNNNTSGNSTNQIPSVLEHWDKQKTQLTCRLNYSRFYSALATAQAGLALALAAEHMPPAAPILIGVGSLLSVSLAIGNRVAANITLSDMRKNIASQPGAKP